ncbi:MAG: 50S ribosomal protein L30 [Anaerolineales bacterium]|nr:50S ribosomal protein L30 [Anaerolineales bacterium]
MSDKIKITLVKSPIGCSTRQKRTVKALGLRRVQSSVEHKDAPTVRGMIDKINHLIIVEEV